MRKNIEPETVTLTLTLEQFALLNVALNFLKEHFESANQVVTGFSPVE
jgi:hypothetical protein